MNEENVNLFDKYWYQAWTRLIFSTAAAGPCEYHYPKQILFWCYYFWPDLLCYTNSYPNDWPEINGISLDISLRSISGPHTPPMPGLCCLLPWRHKSVKTDENSTQSRRLQFYMSNNDLWQLFFPLLPPPPTRSMKRFLENFLILH